MKLIALVAAVQGQTFWSLTVELNDYGAETDTTRRCET